MDFVPAARVVEGGETLQPKSHLSRHCIDTADNLVMIGLLAALAARLDGHEISNFSDAFVAELTGDQHVRVGNIDLVVYGRGNRIDLEIPSFAIMVNLRAAHWS